MADFLKLTAATILLFVVFAGFLYYKSALVPGPEKGLYLHKSGDAYDYCQINTKGYQLILRDTPETDTIRLSYTLNTLTVQKGGGLLDDSILSYDDKSLVMQTKFSDQPLKFEYISELGYDVQRWGDPVGSAKSFWTKFLFGSAN